MIDIIIMFDKKLMLLRQDKCVLLKSHIAKTCIKIASYHINTLDNCYIFNTLNKDINVTKVCVLVCVLYGKSRKNNFFIVM